MRRQKSQDETKKIRVHRRSFFGEIFDKFYIDSRSKKISLAIAGSLIILLILLFLPALSAQGRISRDTIYLENKWVQTPSVHSGVEIFKTLFDEVSEMPYQPVTLLSLMFDTALGGDLENLALYHVTNLLLHMMNVLLLYALVVSLFKKSYLAWIPLALWAVHPVSAQTVVSVSGRGVLLATFFALLSIFGYVLFHKNKNKGFYFLSLGSFIFTLLASPFFLFLPWVLWIIKKWPLGMGKKNVYEKFSQKLAFWVLSLIAAGVMVFSRSISSMEGSTTTIQVVVHYFNEIGLLFQKILFMEEPLLNASMSLLFPGSVWNLSVFMGFLWSVLGLLCFVFTYKKSKEAFWSIGLLATMVFSVVVLQLIWGKSLETEQVYFIFVSLVFLLMHMLSKLWVYISLRPRDTQKRQFGILRFSAIAFVGMLFMCSNIQLFYWKDTETVLKRSIQLNPREPRFSYALAKEYERLYRDEDAIASYIRAIQFGYPKGRLELAKLYKKTSVEHLAIQHYSFVLNETVVTGEERQEILRALMELRAYETLTTYYEVEKEKKSEKQTIGERLIELYLLQGKEEKALKEYDEILQKNPYQEDLLKQASQLHLMHGSVETARTYAQIGLERNPSDLEFQNRAMEATNILDAMDRLNVMEEMNRVQAE